MKNYFPIGFEDVLASPPHLTGTVYRVSYGVEHYNKGRSAHVVKVQMARNNVVFGRKVPSYPAETDDMEKVMLALFRVKKLAHKKQGTQI